MVKIADLYADLHLDTSRFEGELKTAMARASGRDVNVKLKVDTRDARRGVSSLENNVRSATSGINVFSGRLALMADALLALAPAVSAIGAVAVPAIAALGTATLVAGAAAGTALLAFQGMSDTLKAMSKAALEPTAANFDKMREALKQLSPQARQFAIYLFSLRDEVEQLKASAGKELFGGLQTGLEAAVTRLPEVNGLLEDMGGVLGQLGADAGKALATDRWDVLFSFLNENAGTTLHNLADSLGNVTHGVVELLDAFAPLSGSGLSWVSDLTADFDRWATSLDQTQGFKDFSEYVRQVGPQLVDTVGALAEAIVAIGTAAAPLSGPVLKSIELLAKALATIADSPVGPVLIQAALGMRLFSRGSQVAVPAIEAVSTAILDLRTSVPQTGGKIGALARSVKGLAGPAGFVGLAASASSSNDAVNIFGSAISGAVVGLSVGGPWGAAIGGAVGLIAGIGMAAAGSSDDLEKWDKLVQQQVTDFGQFKKVADDANKALSTHRGEIEETAAITKMMIDVNQDNIVSQNEANAFYQTTGAEGLQLYDKLVGDTTASTKDLSKEQQEAISNYKNLTVGITDLGQAMGVVPLGETVTDTKEMNKIFQQAVPTLNAIGVSYEDWMKAVDSGSTDQIVADMKEYVIQADSAKGRNDTLITSFQALGSEIMTDAEQAKAFATALDSITSPMLTLIDTNDAFHQSLKDMDKGFKGTADSLKGQTQAARDNRAVTNDAIRGSEAHLVAMVAEGKGPIAVAKAMAVERQAIIDRAVARGADRKEIENYINTVGLTPKLITTLFKQAGLPKAKQQAAILASQYAGLPKNIQTYIRTKGVPQGKKDVAALETAIGRKLTNKEKKVVLKLERKSLDTGTKDVEKVLRRMGQKDNKVKLGLNHNKFDSDMGVASRVVDKIDKKHPTPKLDADTSAFDSKMSSSNSTLDNFNQRSVSATVTTHHVDDYTTTTHKAGGGLIQGSGTATSDSVPARLSKGEYVVKAAAVDKYGTDFFDRLNAQRFAKGGEVGGGKRKVFGADTIKDLANGIKQGFDAAQITRQLRTIVQRNYSGKREEALLKRVERLARISEQIKKATKAVENAQNNLRAAVDQKNSFVGDFTGTNSANVMAFGQTPGGIIGGLTSQLSSLREFAANLQKLRQVGYPDALVQQVAAAGIADGNAAAKQLLDAAQSGQAQQISATFGQVNALAAGTAAQLGSQFFDQGIARAKGELTQRQKDLKKWNDLYKQAAVAFAQTLKKELGVGGGHKQGGNQDKAGSGTGSAGGGAGGDRGRREAPLIGHAVIRENVDLDKYERQRAFHNRRTRVGG